jgi:hypothetical protein
VEDAERHGRTEVNLGRFDRDDGARRHKEDAGSACDGASVRERLS